MLNLPARAATAPKVYHRLSPSTNLKSSLRHVAHLCLLRRCGFNMKQCIWHNALQWRRQRLPCMYLIPEFDWGRSRNSEEKINRRENWLTLNSASQRSIVLKFGTLLHCGYRRSWNCENLFPIQSKMANRTIIFNCLNCHNSLKFGMEFEHYTSSRLYGQRSRSQHDVTYQR